MKEIKYVCDKLNINEVYTMNENDMTISDKLGNIIKINPDKVYDKNLPLFIHIMFNDIYAAIESFNDNVSDEELNQYKCEEF